MDAVPEARVSEPGELGYKSRSWLLLLTTSPGFWAAGFLLASMGMVGGVSVLRPSP